MKNHSYNIGAKRLFKFRIELQVYAASASAARASARGARFGDASPR